MTTFTAERLLDSLQGRLNRLEHALRGTAAPDDTEATDIPEITAYDDSLLNRLQRLEKKFAALSAKSPATADLLTLCT
jgi:predicted trehalose synthase